MACRLGPLDDAVHKTMFSGRPAEGKNDIRKVGSTVLVEDVRVKVWFGPAVVENFCGEDRREEKGKNEQELHSWRSSLGASLLTCCLPFVPSPENQ